MSPTMSTDELLAQATCAVWFEGAQKPVGTAWLVSDEGHLITAGHVLGEVTPLEEVTVRFADSPPLVARRVEWRFEREKGIDFAILKLVTEEGAEKKAFRWRRPLPILLDQEVKGTFRLYGYGKSLAVLTSGVGDFVGLHDPGGRQLFRLRCKELKEQGFSGGAVYSEQKQAVVAIQVEVGRGGVTSEMVLAMPMYRIDACSEHLREVIGHQISKEAPYRGLLYFEEEHADLFFGREQLINQLLERLPDSPQALENWQTDHLLAIVGASGSGKSSLVRAGLLPKLRQRGWQIRIITPTAHPLKALAAALASDEVEMLRLMTMMANEARILDVAVQRRMGSHQGLLLVVDQFEELFTLCKDESERQFFLANLMHAVAAQTASPTQLILTLRADFYHHSAPYPALREALERHQAFIGPMTGDELRQAIVEPARTYGYQLEAGLVELILRDSGVTNPDKMPEPGALPLLSHALLETWQRREGNILTLQGYQEAGGVKGAIAITAEREYNHLTPPQQQLARNIFLRLTELGEGTQDTRRRASLNELIPEDEQAIPIHQLLKQLADKRLITTSQEGAEVAHEALIRQWPRLREWLDSDRDALRLHRRLTEAAQEWHTHNRETSYLYTGARLQQALDWAADPAANQPNLLEQTFLQASQSQQEARLAAQEAARREREQLLEARAAAETRNASRLRTFLAVATVLLLIALAAAGFAFERQQEATNAEETAVAEANRAVKAESAAQAEATRAVSAEKAAVAEAERAELAATQEAIARDEEVKAREDAEAQARIARAQANASQALVELTNNPDRALLLALAAIHADTESPQVVVLRALRNTVGTTRIRQVFAGYTGRVRLVAFSPTGQQVLTGSEDDTVYLWDAQTGQLMHTLEGNTFSVKSVAFSPTGELVGTRSGSEVRLWDAQTGQLMHTLQGKSVAFSPTGEQMLTSSPDGTARLWDAQTGQLMHTLQGESVAFSPTGQLLIGSVDDTARLWDAQTGQLIHTLQGHSGWVDSVAFSPTGEQVLTGSRDNTARLWDVRTGQYIHILEGHDSWVMSVAFSPSGAFLLTSSVDGTARLWDTQTGQLLHTHILLDMVRRTGAVPVWPAVAFNPNEALVLIGSRDGTVRLWDAQMKTEVYTLQGHTDMVRSVAFSPTGEQVLTGSDDGTARLWDAQTGTELHPLPWHIDKVSVMFSPSAEKVLTNSSDGTVRLWDTQTGTEIHPLQGHTREVASVAFSPSGEQVLTGSSDETARLWDAQTGTEIHTLRHTREVTSVAFSPTGEQVLTGSDDNTARLWDAQTGTEIHTLQGHTHWVMSVAFSPSGEQVLTGSGDGTARLWDAQTGSEIHILRHTRGVTSVAFSSSGEQVLTGSEDGTARLWDTQTGSKIHTLQGHTDNLTMGSAMSVAFSPSGKQVLTGSEDGTARLWDVQTGTELHILQEHFDKVTSVAFSPNGAFVLTGSDNGTVRLWDVQTGQAINTLAEEAYSVAFSPSGELVAMSSSDGVRLWIADDNLLIAKLTSLVCGVWGHDEEAISAEIPDWRGCEVELEAVKEDLARYKELRGE